MQEPIHLWTPIHRTCCAVSRFWGKGMPWVMMVLSRATTGRPDPSAAATSALTTMPLLLLVACSAAGNAGQALIKM